MIGSHVYNSLSVRDELLSLAARCEAATGPDRELDWAIDAFMRPNEYRGMETADDLGHPLEWLSAEDLPYFTASLDAAMTLVPKGDDHDLSFERTMRGGEDFKLWQVRYSLETVEEDPEETGPIILGEAVTAPLALCAAALKALSDNIGEEGK